MFLFQVAKAALPSVSSLESQLFKTNPKDAKELAALQKAALDLAKSSSDQKSQALAYFTLIWVSGRQSQLEVSSNASSEAQKIIKDGAANDYMPHYKNLLAVLEASRMQQGGLALTPSSIAKLTGILDLAEESASMQRQAKGFTESERNYFVFANEAQAKEFITILSALPGAFSTAVGRAEQILGKDYVDRKSLSGAYVVDFACTGYSGQVARQSQPLKSKLAVSQGTEKSSRIRWRFTGSEMDDSEKAIVQFAAGQMALTGQGDGKVELSGKCELYYGVKHNIDPIKDREEAKDLATMAFRELTRQMGIDMDKSMTPPPTLEKFMLETDAGKEFVTQFNLGAPKVSGSASVEVFYNGKNYEAFRNSLRDNWQLALDRAGLIKEYVDETINQKLTAIGKPPLNVEAAGRLYLFQDLDASVIQRLQDDGSLPADLRAWFGDYSKSQQGTKHMNELMAYLKQNGGEDKRNSYEKIKAAIGSVAENADGTVSCDLSGANWATINTLWQRTSNNKSGLRVETLNNQSMLAKAIEDSGDGTSRSASITTSAQAPISIDMAALQQSSFEVKQGESASISAAVSASSPLANVTISAYLVNKSTGTLTPLQVKNSQVAAEISESGDYALVAYAKTEDGRIKTTFVGQGFSVSVKEEKPEPLEQQKYRNRADMRPPASRVEGRIPVNLSIPGVPTPSDDSQMSELINALKPLYEGVGVSVDENGTFHPEGRPENLPAVQITNFFSGFRQAVDTWIDKNKSYILENLNNPADFESFRNELLQSNFSSALAYLNQDENSACRAQLYNSLKSTFSSDVLNVVSDLSAYDLNSLTKWSFSARGNLNFMLTGTKYIDTYMKDDVAAKLRENGIAIPQNALDKALSKLKRKNDQAVAYTSKGDYAFAMGEKGQVSVYKLPKMPVQLNLCLMETGNVLIVNDATLHKLEGVAMLIGRINLGEKVSLQPYINVSAVHSLTAGKTDDLGVFFDFNRIKVGVDAGAGAILEYRFNDFISGLLEGSLGVSTLSKSSPRYGAAASAGVEMRPTEDLGIQLRLNSQFAPHDPPLFTGNLGLKYKLGVVSLDANGRYSFTRNAIGKHPWGFGVGLTFDL